MLIGEPVTEPFGRRVAHLFPILLSSARGLAYSTIRV